MSKNYITLFKIWAGTALVTLTILGTTAAHASEISFTSPIEIMLDAPTVTSFSPTSGCAAGTLITITGTDFTNATAVTIGGIPASFTVDSATQITAVTAIGTVSGVISVTTPEGSSDSASPFTVYAAPTAVDINQDAITVCQNTVVPLSATGGTTAGDIATSIVLTQGFEGAAATGWTIENTSGSTAADWAYRTTSHTGSRAPHTGTHLASFDGRAFAAYSGKLITPVMDLSAYTTQVTLNFWYQQPTWGGDQNVLKVYYRANAAAAWTMIWSDLTSKTTWTAATVILPAVSATYQIAFEGTSAYGYSIVLDDVVVTGVGPAQPQYIWLPIAGLYSDAAATIAYTGQPTATVYADPATTTTYTVSSTNIASCTSLDSVEITVTTIAEPDGEAQQIFGDGDTVADLIVTGTDLLWYSDAAATTEIPTSTPLVGGTSYYVTQTIGSCESNPLEIVAQQELSTPSYVRARLKAYPNPVKGQLNISYAGIINDVEIHNMVGQKIGFQTIGAADGRIDFSQLKNGTYLITVMTADGRHTIKVVKE